MNKNPEFYLGIDVGGTKCAVSLGYFNATIHILSKEKIPTNLSGGPLKTLQNIQALIEKILLVNKLDRRRICGIGISCGGPLDSNKGIILSPPNLPGWDNIRISDFFSQKFKVPVTLEQDANACALAEHQFGAGRGLKNIVFLTFGTGMGAGLILNNSLYRGVSGMAGELGHIRLEEEGPTGYGKEGSVEGFCSGAGIARLGLALLENANENDKLSSLYTAYKDGRNPSAKDIAQAADMGDALAEKIFTEVGEKLGKTLAMIIDFLNPECIIIGSIYLRARHLLDKSMLRIVKEECLFQNYKDCSIVPAKLGEELGDYAALAVAMRKLKKVPETGQF